MQIAPSTPGIPNEPVVSSRADAARPRARQPLAEGHMTGVSRRGGIGTLTVATVPFGVIDLIFRTLPWFHPELPASRELG